MAMFDRSLNAMYAGCTGELRDDFHGQTTKDETKDWRDKDPDMPDQQWREYVPDSAFNEEGEYDGKTRPLVQAGYRYHNGYGPGPDMLYKGTRFKCTEIQADWKRRTYHFELTIEGGDNGSEKMWMTITMSLVQALRINFGL